MDSTRTDFPVTDYNEKLKKLAAQLGADYERVLVWNALIGVGSDEPEDWLVNLTDLLNRSPYTVQELSHILLSECGPVVWHASAPEDFIPRCLARQRVHRFKSSGDPNRILLGLHFLAPVWFDAYLLLGRVQALRCKK